MLKQRNIFFFLPNFSIGGAGNSIFNICNKINDKNKSIKVISIGKNHYKNKFQKIGIKVIEINTKKTIFGIFKIIDILKKNSNNKKIIFVSNINYANVLSSIFIKNIKNLKLILIERTPFQELETYFNFTDFLKKKIIFYLSKIFYKRANYIIGNSLDVSNYIKKKLNLDILTIYPIIKKGKVKTLKNKKILTISWIGRNSKEKNLSDFLLAINLLKSEKIQINIVSNNLTKKDISQVTSKDIYKKIKIYNYSHDKSFLKKIYINTNIFVNTSIYEGFPNTIVEAVNYECLVISSKSYGGRREIIKNNKYGLLYNTYNHLQLYKKIKFAIHNYDKCKDKILAAKENIINMANINNNKYKKFFNTI
tara:strand:+ start:10936 stop:12030 length:1095 start_codon:yes stop_codon:yes gene_type:complete